MKTIRSRGAALSLAATLAAALALPMVVAAAEEEEISWAERLSQGDRPAEVRSVRKEA